MGRERFYLVVRTVILLHEGILQNLFVAFARLIYCICKTYLLHLQDLFVAFAKIYSVRYLLNLRAVLKARDRSHVLPMDDSEGGDAQQDTSL